MRLLFPTSLSCVSLLLLLLTCTTLISRARALSNSCPSNPKLSPNLTSTTDAFSLAPSYSAALLHQDLTAELQIRDTLSLYPLAIDGKNFAALDLVFTPDVVANYSPPLNVLTPLANVITALNESLRPVTTQHLLGTQIIDVRPGACEARSLTYYTASHFGTRDFYGEV